jgi:hypothetical protein
MPWLFGIGAALSIALMFVSGLGLSLSLMPAPKAEPLFMNLGAAPVHFQQPPVRVPTPKPRPKRCICKHKARYMTIEIKGFAQGVLDAKAQLATARAAISTVHNSATRFAAGCADIAAAIDKGYDDVMFEAQTLGNGSSPSAPAPTAVAPAVAAGETAGQAWPKRG